MSRPIILALLPAAALAEPSWAEPARSLVPLSQQMQWKHFGDKVPPANSRFGAKGLPQRRRMTTLTDENTDPIRITVDYSSLYEETAPQYTACFQVGAWFARGLPGPDPPTDGVATCARDGTDTDCWGKCEADDLITPEGRDAIIAVVDIVTAEVEGMFALQRSTEPLVFEDDVGRYSGAYSSKGYPVESACARDCQLLNGVAVADSYCTDGVAADAVFSIVKPPTIPGVAGTGGACSSDSTGRPTWLVFSWIQKITSMSGSTAELLEQHRALVIHELLHALGFSNVQFRSARDSAGNNKGLIELQYVENMDGSDPDEVWFFVNGRAYELAQTYFDCLDNASWTGLPLMGFPDLGRASHWETRILRDDVMSYGGFATVSAITLAAMEDLGFYKANYSAAQCMSWGRHQGCNYVVTRCGAGYTDRSQVVENQDECDGNPQWSVFPHLDAQVEAHCDGGFNPCGDLEGSGYTVSGGVRRCNAQCYTGTDRDDCRAAPTAALETAGEGGLSSFGDSVHWEQFLWLAAWAVGGLLFVSILRQFLCPKPGSRRVLGIVSGVMVCAGLSCVVFNVLVLAEVDTYPELDLLGQEVREFIGEYVMVGFLCLGLLLTLIGFASLLGICTSSPKLMLGMWLVLFVFLVAQVLITVLLLYWVWVLDDVPNTTLDTLQGASDGRYDGKFGESALIAVEGFMCQTYRKCCRTSKRPSSWWAHFQLSSWPPLALLGCAPRSTGATEPASAPCRGQGEQPHVRLRTRGHDHRHRHLAAGPVVGELLRAPPTGICNPLDSIYPLDTCQEHFCTSGAEGYFDFVMNFVAHVREYATGFGGAFALLVMVQCVLLINLWNLRARFKKQAALEKAQAPRGDHRASADGIAIGIVPAEGSGNRRKTKKSSTKAMSDARISS